MSSSFDDFTPQSSDALQSTLDSTNTSLMDGQNFSHDTYTQSAFDSHSLNETAYQSDPFSTQDQWQDTSSMDGQSFSHDTYTQSAFDSHSLNETAYQSDPFSTQDQWQDTSSVDGQNFSHDTYTQSAFDHNSLTETAYQSDHSSTENQWQNTAFQSTPELNQEIDALLNGNDSSDDSNSQNASNLTAPTFQHHVHYHPPHEHFNTPSLHEGERVASSESSVFHSSMDVNVSGSVDHYHRWVNPNNSYSGSDGGSSSSDSNAPSSGTSSSCTDANGDGQCDSGDSN